jgi:hypothetical protein
MTNGALAVTLPAPATAPISPDGTARLHVAKLQQTPVLALIGQAIGDLLVKVAKQQRKARSRNRSAA